MVYFKFISIFFLAASVLCQERCTNEDVEMICRDGSCISREYVCDGSNDCIDGEDESNDKCQFRPCSTSSGFSSHHEDVFHLNDVSHFRCNYGACISKLFICDGVANCRDNSDESEKLCGKNTCGPVQFRCKYGGCIPLIYLCNGIISCHDGSDETLEVCKDVLCNPAFQTQCDYGGCIRRDQKCNGFANCADESDESEEACGKGHKYRSLNPFANTPTTTTPRTDFRLEPPPSTGSKEGCSAINAIGSSYELQGCGGQSCDGDILPVGTRANAHCEGDQFYLLSCDESFKWVSVDNPAVSMSQICNLKEIPSTTSNNRIPNDNGCSVTSFRSHFQVLRCGRGQFLSDCDGKQYMPVGSILTQECTPSDTIVMSCSTNKIWQISNDNGQPGKSCQLDIVKLKNECGRTKRLIGEAAGFSWPFLVGLFRNQVYICTGTLISYNIVLTSGHCLTRNKASSTDFIAPMDLTIQHYKRGRIVFTPVASIHVHSKYIGGTRPKYDIAIVKLTRFATSEDEFEPACLDYEGILIKKQGIVFNRTEGNLDFKWTEFGQTMDLSCFNRNTPCSQHLGIDLNQYCGINENSDNYLHPGSSGGPYLIQVNTNNEETKWAVAGVVSHVVQTKKKRVDDIPCKKPHTVFASVFHLKKWIIDCGLKDIC